MDSDTGEDIVLQLSALADYAERADHWTDDKRLMDAAGVADTVHGAIHRIEELEEEAKKHEAIMKQLEEWGREDLNALPDCLMKLAPALVRVSELEEEVRRLRGDGTREGTVRVVNYVAVKGSDGAEVFGHRIEQYFAGAWKEIDLIWER